VDCRPGSRESACCRADVKADEARNRAWVHTTTGAGSLPGVALVAGLANHLVHEESMRHAAVEV